MYLKLDKKIPPIKVAQMLDTELSEDEVNYDYENVYEWVYLNPPGYDCTLNISRDHGQSEIDDDLLDEMTEDQILSLPEAGETYITSERPSIIPNELIRYIAEKTESKIKVFKSRLNIEGDDGVPDFII